MGGNCASCLQTTPNNNKCNTSDSRRLRGVADAPVPRYPFSLASSPSQQTVSRGAAFVLPGMNVVQNSDDEGALWHRTADDAGAPRVVVCSQLSVGVVATTEEHSDSGVGCAAEDDPSPAAAVASLWNVSAVPSEFSLLSCHLTRQLSCSQRLQPSPPSSPPPLSAGRLPPALALASFDLHLSAVGSHGSPTTHTALLAASDAANNAHVREMTSAECCGSGAGSLRSADPDLYMRCGEQCSVSWPTEDRQKALNISLPSAVLQVPSTGDSSSPCLDTALDERL